MKVTVWVGKNFSVDVEGSDDKTLFEGIAEAQSHEFFRSGCMCCGKCKSENVKFQIREVKDEAGESNKFHEIICLSCFAKLSFGHAKVGGRMYAKTLETGAKGKATKDDDGKGIKLPNGGWLKWNKETGKNE